LQKEMSPTIIHKSEGASFASTASHLIKPNDIDGIGNATAHSGLASCQESA